MRSIAEVDQRGEHAVSKAPQPCDVTAAAVRGESGSFCEIRTIRQHMHELRYFSRIRRTVRVHHGDDVAGRGLEPAGKRVPFSAASLLHYPHVGP